MDYKNNKKYYLPPKINTILLLVGIAVGAVGLILLFTNDRSAGLMAGMVASVVGFGMAIVAKTSSVSGGEIDDAALRYKQLLIDSGEFYNPDRVKPGTVYICEGFSKENSEYYRKGGDGILRSTEYGVAQYSMEKDSLKVIAHYFSFTREYDEEKTVMIKYQDVKSLEKVTVFRPDERFVNNHLYKLVLKDINDEVVIETPAQDTLVAEEFAEKLLRKVKRVNQLLAEGENAPQ